MKQLLLSLLILFAAFGCQKKADKEQMQSLRIDFQEGDLPSLHPHDLVIYLRGLSISKTLYETLTRINTEGNVELAGAEKVEISPDQLHYIFTLRDQWWSDGTKVTAYQYEKGWKGALAPLSTCTRADLLYCIKNGAEAKQGLLPLDAIGVKALDEKTLSVELDYPTPYFLELTTQCLTAPVQEMEHQEPKAFNGPFMVDEWKKGNCMYLKPNPFYWDKKNIHLKTIEIYFVEDVNTVFSLFEKGELDWVGVPLCPLSAELIQQLYQEKNLNSKAIGRSFYIFLNTEHPILKSTKIRQALSLAVDRTAITGHILLGGQPSEKPLSHLLLPLPPLSSLKEDRALAKEYFAKGLEELNLTKKELPPLEISYSQQANRKQVAEYLQEQWSQIFDIKVSLKNVEWNILRSNLEKGLFTISMAYEGAYYRDPLEVLERYTTRNPANFSQWLHPPFSQKIAEAKYESNAEQRMHLLAEAEKLIVEEMPHIPICSDCLLFSHPTQLKDFVLDSLGAIDFSRAHF